MKPKQQTFSERFCLEDANFFQRLIRDIRLLWFFCMTFVMWLKAGKVRAEFKRCRESNEPFYVDRFGPK